MEITFSFIMKCICILLLVNECQTGVVLKNFKSRRTLMAELENEAAEAKSPIDTNHSNATGVSGKQKDQNSRNATNVTEALSISEEQIKPKHMNESKSSAKQKTQLSLNLTNGNDILSKGIDQMSPSHTDEDKNSMKDNMQVTSEITNATEALSNPKEQKSKLMNEDKVSTKPKTQKLSQKTEALKTPTNHVSNFTNTINTSETSKDEILKSSNDSIDENETLNFSKSENNVKPTNVSKGSKTKNTESTSKSKNPVTNIESFSTAVKKTVNSSSHQHTTLETILGINIVPTNFTQFSDTVNVNRSNSDSNTTLIVQNFKENVNNKSETRSATKKSENFDANLVNSSKMADSTSATEFSLSVEHRENDSISINSTRAVAENVATSNITSKNSTAAETSNVDHVLKELDKRDGTIAINLGDETTAEEHTQLKLKTPQNELLEPPEKGNNETNLVKEKHSILDKVAENSTIITTLNKTNTNLEAENSEKLNDAKSAADKIDQNSSMSSFSHSFVIYTTDAISTSTTGESVVKSINPLQNVKNDQKPLESNHDELKVTKSNAGIENNEMRNGDKEVVKFEIETNNQNANQSETIGKIENSSDFVEPTIEKLNEVQFLNESKSSQSQVDKETENSLQSASGLDFLLNSEVAKNAALAMEVFNLSDTSLTDHVIEDSDLHSFIDLMIPSLTDSYKEHGSDSNNESNIDSEPMLTDTINSNDTEESDLDVQILTEEDSSEKLNITIVAEKKRESLVATDSQIQPVANATLHLIDKARECPPPGICLFWFGSRDTCSHHSQCVDSKLCCRVRCSKHCIDV